MRSSGYPKRGLILFDRFNVFKLAKGRGKKPISLQSLKQSAAEQILATGLITR